VIVCIPVVHSHSFLAQRYTATSSPAISELIACLQESCERMLQSNQLYALKTMLHGTQASSQVLSIVIIARNEHNLLDSEF